LFLIEIWKFILKKPTIGGPWRVVCNKAGWCKPAGPKSNVSGWPHSVGKKAAPSSSRKIKQVSNKKHLSTNDVRGIWINCWVAVVNWFCVGCLGFWTLVFDLANSSRRVAGRSGSNRTP